MKIGININKLVVVIGWIVIVYIGFVGAQTQIGADIEGEAVDDSSGFSVSLNTDGSIVAIGAIRNSGSFEEAGHVRIYENMSGAWTQIGADIDGEAGGDHSGISVSLNADGSIVAIGASGNDGNGSFAGHVRVYENVSGVWTQIGNDIDGEASEDSSGVSISLNADGSIVAIGANGNDGNGTRAGHVRVYENVSGVWTQIGNDIDGEAPDNESGWSVCLNADGSIVVIGAPGNDGNGSAAGHVRVYENISGTWTQIGADIDGEIWGEDFGYLVSINADGSIIAIGTRVHSSSDPDHVRIYENNSNSWVQVGADINGDTPGDFNGISASINDQGNIVAIKVIQTGRVRIYENLSGTWTQLGEDIFVEECIDFYGHSISLSGDGATVAIGVPISMGHVIVYSVPYSVPTLASWGVIGLIILLFTSMLLNVRSEDNLNMQIAHPLTKAD